MMVTENEITNKIAFIKHSYIQLVLMNKNYIHSFLVELYYTQKS